MWRNFRLCQYRKKQRNTGKIEEKATKEIWIKDGYCFRVYKFFMCHPIVTKISDTEITMEKNR